MIDLAWPPGTPITGRPTFTLRADPRHVRKEAGYLLATGLLAGQRVAYVMWKSPRPGSINASSFDWLDTVPLSAVTRRWTP